MGRPLLLDLFCGAGGAAMGYHRAGFDVVGVDAEPQPNYPFPFHQDDALLFLEGLWIRDHYDGCPFPYHAVHASPPCQAYSRATAWRGDRKNHPDLIDAVRDRLAAFRCPYVIENVQEARGKLRCPIMLCGSMVGLKIRRHRYFEVHPGPFFLTPPCQHRDDDFSFDHGGKQTESEYRDAMGCDWMTVHEAREAIPPAFTELIGRQLIQRLFAEVPQP